MNTADAVPAPFCLQILETGDAAILSGEMKKMNAEESGEQSPLQNPLTRVCSPPRRALDRGLAPPAPWAPPAC